MRTFLVALQFLIAAFLVSNALAQICVPPPAGVIAWWPMDEISGMVVGDVAGNNSGVRVDGPISAAGQVGNSLRFNGTGSSVSTPDSALWAFGTTDFTIEFWANWDAPGSGDIVHAGDVFIGSDDGPGNQNKWFFALGGGVLHFTVYNTANPPPNFYLIQAPFFPVVGQWYHLAVTKRGTLFTIYVNGVALGAEISEPPIANANAPLTIGRANEPFGGFMNGRLDEMTIYNRALSQGELQAIATVGSAGKCKKLGIATKSLPAIKLGEPTSTKLQANLGQPPFTWSISSGALPKGLTLSSDGTLAGTPVEVGEFKVTVKVSDATSAAEKTFVQRVLLMPPPPQVSIRKSGTVAVPGRTIDYFIVVENIGDSRATDVIVVERLEPPSNFILKSTIPEARFDGGEVISWILPILDPGQSVMLQYKATLSAKVPLGSFVAGEVCMCKTDECTLATIACFPPGCPDVSSCGCTHVILACYESCHKRHLPLSCSKDLKAAVGPFDPNEKLVVANRFVRSEQTLTYPIHFENIGKIEARDVFITDILDPNLDVSTLKLLTSHGGTFDLQTRTVKWSLLDKNLLPGASDNVLLSIKPRTGLPSGTVIRNTGVIQFEVFAPIATNQVVTIIDDVSPVCRVNSLPAQTKTRTFIVSWTGTDLVGEIDSYTVLVSRDGGGYAPLQENTKDKSLTFTGEVNSRYDFLCVAQDTAGNVETQALVAEASTQVVDAPPNPADINQDGKVDCSDLAIIKAFFGKKAGQTGFDARADTNKDNVVDVRDLAFVSQRLPAGTRCQ